MDEGASRRQARWQELTKRECFEMLSREHLGRIALVDAWGPIVLPVNFALDHHTVVFRTGEGTKLDAASTGPRVAFEVDGADAPARTGWSVVVRGEAVEVTEPAELARLRELPLYPWAPCAGHRYVRVLPAVLTGRRISLPAEAPPDVMPPWEHGLRKKSSASPTTRASRDRLEACLAALGQLLDQPWQLRVVPWAG